MVTLESRLNLIKRVGPYELGQTIKKEDLARRSATPNYDDEVSEVWEMRKVHFHI